MRNIILIMAVTLATPALADSKVSATGTPFEGASITFTENEFGPQLDGLTFAINGKEAVGIFFGGRKKQWCAVIKDSKEGTNLDCGFLNKGGEISVWVTGKPELKASAVHATDRTLKISWTDSSKQLVLKGNIEVNATTRVATAKLEVGVWDGDKAVTTASHHVDGIYLSASAQIKREIGKIDRSERNPAKTN